MLGPDETRGLNPVALPEGTALPALLYSSSDEGVAMVRPDGTVVGLNGGTAVLTVSTADGRFSAQCRVKVSERESTRYSLLIMAVIGTAAALAVLVFAVVYRRFIKRKALWERRKYS